MAITRTAKGTATDKSSGLTLTISSVQVERRLLVAGLTYDTGNGHPVVKWGNHCLEPIETINGNGVITRIVAYRRRRAALTRDIVATWTTTAPTAKVMWASTFSNVGTLDLASSASQAATGSPNSGTAASSTIADEVFIGCMGSEGPTSDTAGTPSGSYTAGQRAGTGPEAPPASNITCAEIFKIVSATESTQAEITGATERDWSSVLTTWSDDRKDRFNVIQYDWEEALDIFNDADIDARNAVLKRNLLLGRLELYEVDIDADATLKAYWVDDDSTDWTTV